MAGLEETLGAGPTKKLKERFGMGQTDAPAAIPQALSRSWPGQTSGGMRQTNAPMPKFGLPTTGQTRGRGTQIGSTQTEAMVRTPSTIAGNTEEAVAKKKKAATIASATTRTPTMGYF